uniref:ADP-ribosylation factor-like protein 6 n=1 Tax=Ciona intestinalis TaxID=7719 RepID=UPI0000522558|nr:ADP-ribosylation factor-like protein 6 [Ciona intestinalis]|eukprot:XP_002128692.1 ADP-ribosylation factor-like protein 6 [Ciona intestinalis]
MGILDKLASWLNLKKKEARILCVGLDNSGKSTIINQLKPVRSRNVEVVPTVGFCVEQFNAGALSFTVFDMSGQGRYRSLWEHYYNSCDAIIFVVDSTDRIRMTVAKEELNQLLRHKQIVQKRSLPFLFFSNKSDLRQSVSAVKCAQLMGLDAGEWVRGGSPIRRNMGKSPTGRPWHICPCNALTGEGLNEGLGWLSDQIITLKSK